MSIDAQFLCSLCGATEHTTFFKARDARFNLPEEFTLVRCSTCGLVSVYPQPSDETLSHHYPAEYYTHASPRPTVKDRFNYSLFQFLFFLFEGNKLHSGIVKKALQFIASQSSYARHIVEINGLEYLPGAGSTFLEVGFGHGDFLNFLAKRGYVCTGVENDPVCCENMQKQGHTAFCGEVLELQLAENIFDFIRMRHTLEHIRQPVETVKKLFDVQRPGGYIFIEVPNFDGAYSKIFREDWAQLEPPRHLFHFTEETLSRILVKAGYTIVGTVFDTQPWQLLTSMQYSLGSQKNSNSVIRSLQRISSSLHKLSSMLTSLGMGDNIIIVAQKHP